jgi:hypothetical protein
MSRWGTEAALKANKSLLIMGLFPISNFKNPFHGFKPEAGFESRKGFLF